MHLARPFLAALLARTTTTAPPRRRAGGPEGRLIGGHLSEFRRDRLGFYTSIAREYGDVVAFRLGPKRFLLVNDPELIRQVLAADSHDYRKVFHLRTSRLLFGDGLLTSEGDFWRRQRRLAQPAFHHQRIAAYGQVMVAEAERQLAGWRDGQTLDVHAELMDLTLRIVARVLFGADVAAHAGVVADAFQVAAERFVVRMEQLLPLPERLPTPGNLRLRRAAGRLDRLVYRIIGERRADGGDHGDLLSMLLAARDPDEPGGGGSMSDRQLRDEVLTLLLAGHESTAIALTWTFYLLSQHPEVEARFAAELRTVLGERTLTVADLPRLDYAGRVVTEAMRLYPPVWAFGRDAIRDLTLGGYRVPAGTSVLVSQWVLHRDPRFFADPERFDPDRWADGLAGRLPRFAYLPFGGGPRRCIGGAFATTEAVLLLATIAGRFRLTLAPGHPVALWSTITLRPRHGMRMELHQRPHPGP